MADSVVKLRIDSQEYDAKLKKAGAALVEFFNSAKLGQKTMKDVDHDTMAAIKAIGTMATEAKTTRRSLREMTQTLTDLTAAYRSMSTEQQNSAAGKALADSLRQLTERAGEAKDAMLDVEGSIVNAASDTRLFDQLAGGANLLTSGFQTLQGAAEMLGIDIGDNVEVIAKLQAAMAVTNGLTQIQTQLQKQSAMMQGVLAVQAKAAAAATMLQGNASKAATVAQAAFNAVAKANPYVLLATAVAAVGTALFAFAGKAKEATDAIEENTEAMEEAKKMADVWKNAMSSTFTSLMTKYDDLKKQWTALRTEHEKREWIKKNQTALNNLGGAVYDVKTAEDFFNKNTDAVVQAFVRRAQAAARVAQLTELYRKQIELIDQKERTSRAIAADAAKGGRSAKAGDIISDESFHNERYGGVNSAGKWVFSEKGAALYSGTDTSTSSSVMAIDVKLRANEQEIQRVKGQITNDFSDTYVPIAVTPAGGGRGGHGGGGGDDKNEVVKTEQQIINEKIQALTQEYITASEGRRAAIQDEIRDLQIRNNEIERLINEAKGLGEITGNGNVSGESSKTPGEKLLERVKDRIAEANIESDTAALENALGAMIQNGIDGIEINVDSILEQLREGMNIPDEYWENLQNQINEKLKEMGSNFTLEIDPKTGSISKNFAKEGKEAGESWRQTASAIQSVGSAMQQVENPAAKIMGIIGEAIANIALGFSKQSLEAAGGGPLAWIAAIAGGLATMTSTIAAIKSATAGSYAEGGIVPGNKYHDEMVANVSSGELILNRAQQYNIANALTGGANNMQLEAYISGEDLRLAVSRANRRRNRGEYAYSKKV